MLQLAPHWVSTQTLLDLLEVPQRGRNAGACRRLAKLMLELGWTPIKARGMTQNGFRDQVRGLREGPERAGSVVVRQSGSVATCYRFTIAPYNPRTVYASSTLSISREPHANETRRAAFVRSGCRSSF
jgi:hypothetical protein